MRIAIVAVVSLVACGGAESSATQDASPSIDSTGAPPCVASVTLADPTPPIAEHADCLADTSAFDASWVLKDNAWCIVAHYDFPASFVLDPTMTWGRHGGPLQGGGSTIVRWSPPASPTGTMTATTQNVDATSSVGIPTNGWAVDLPFDDSTAIGPSSDGYMLIVRDGHVLAKTSIAPASVPVGLATGASTRIVFESTAPSALSAAIDAVDDCGPDACDAIVHIEEPTVSNLTPRGVISDPSGNVFAAFDEGRGAYGTYEHLRAYDRSRIAPTACPTAATSAETYGDIVPATDGERIYYGARGYDSGIETVAYHRDSSGQITFGPYAQFVGPVGGGGWYFGALLVDDRGRLWALNVVDKTSTFWVFARR